MQMHDFCHSNAPVHLFENLMKGTKSARNKWEFIFYYASFQNIKLILFSTTVSGIIK